MLMKRDPSLAVAVGLGVVLAVLMYPLTGWTGAVAAGAAGFYVGVLIGSGYGSARAIAWGVLVIALFSAGVLASGPIAAVTPGAAAVLFFAGVLSPTFRGWWFGQHIE
jgi:hypothetical protein